MRQIRRQVRRPHFRHFLPVRGIAEFLEHFQDVLLRFNIRRRVGSGTRATLFRKPVKVMLVVGRKVCRRFYVIFPYRILLPKLREHFRQIHPANSPRFLPILDHPRQNIVLPVLGRHRVRVGPRLRYPQLLRPPDVPQHTLPIKLPCPLNPQMAPPVQMKSLGKAWVTTAA